MTLKELLFFRARLSYSSKEYRYANKRIWGLRNPDRQKEIQRKCEFGTPEKHEHKKAYQRKAALDLREQVLSVYGGKCKFCGDSTPEYLQLDHVDSNPEKNAKGRRRGGRDLYIQVRREGFPKKYRLLCANCNWARARYGDVVAQKLGFQRRQPQAVERVV